MVESANLAVGDSCEGLEDKAFDLPSLDQISADLKSNEASIVLKMNHLYALREWGGTEATSLLIQALKDRTTIDSVLFRQAQLTSWHEITYASSVPQRCMTRSFWHLGPLRCARPSIGFIACR